MKLFIGTVVILSMWPRVSRWSCLLWLW